jgi:hypothetical protein
MKRTSEFSVEKDLNEAALKGWRLVAVIREEGDGFDVNLVLERDR